jgi:phage tail sheath protein FI
MAPKHKAPKKRAADTEWKYVPIRRFIAFLEDSINKVTNWWVHELKETEKRKEKKKKMD